MRPEEQSAASRGPRDPDVAPLLDVCLTPYRSLTPRTVRLIMTTFSLAVVVVSLPFVMMGAWPVVGLMGLDILVLHVAFRASFRSARAYEHVLVTPLELFFAKVSQHGKRREFRFHPAWVRLDREEHEEFGIQRLALLSRGRSVEIAGFLGPDAKARFASGLTRALAEARRGPRYS